MSAIGHDASGRSFYKIVTIRRDPRVHATIVLKIGRDQIFIAAHDGYEQLPVVDMAEHPQKVLLDTRIDDMEFPNRVKNACQHRGCPGDRIVFVGDLVQVNERDLLSRRGFGRVSLSKVKEILAQHGLLLGMGEVQRSWERPSIE